MCYVKYIINPCIIYFPWLKRNKVEWHIASFVIFCGNSVLVKVYTFRNLVLKH